MSNKRKKSGFTLVEIVISMAIAMLVSFSAISVVLLANSIAARSSEKHSAINQIDNLTECFKSATTEAEFNAAIRFYYDDAVYDYPDGTPPVAPLVEPQYYILEQTEETGSFTDTYKLYFDQNNAVVVLNMNESGALSSDILNISHYSGTQTVNYVIELVLTGTVTGTDRTISESTMEAYKITGAGDKVMIYPATDGETVEQRKVGESGVS